jgi:hypothetical protein
MSVPGLVADVVSQWLNTHNDLFHEVYGLRVASTFLKIDLSSLINFPTVFSLSTDVPCNLSLVTHCRNVFLEDKSILKCDSNGQIIVPAVSSIVQLDLPGCANWIDGAFVLHLPFLRKLNLSSCSLLVNVSHLGNL